MILISKAKHGECVNCKTSGDNFIVAIKQWNAKEGFKFRLCENCLMKFIGKASDAICLDGSDEPDDKSYSDKVVELFETINNEYKAMCDEHPNSCSENGNCKYYGTANCRGHFIADYMIEHNLINI